VNPAEAVRPAGGPEEIAIAAGHLHRAREKVVYYPLVTISPMAVPTVNIFAGSAAERPLRYCGSSRASSRSWGLAAQYLEISENRLCSM
jgi:hypothetical protein